MLLFTTLLYFTVLTVVTVVTADIAEYLLVMSHLININHCTAVLFSLSPISFLHKIYNLLTYIIPDISPPLPKLIEFVI